MKKLNIVELKNLGKQVRTKRQIRFPQITDREIGLALRKKRGFISDVAKLSGTSQSNIKTRIKHSPFLQKVLYEIEETRLDKAEKKLHALIEQGYYPAIKDFFRWKGHSRGLGQDEIQINEERKISLNLEGLPRNLLEYLANTNEDEIIDVESFKPE